MIVNYRSRLNVKASFFSQRVVMDWNNSAYSNIY